MKWLMSARVENVLLGRQTRRTAAAERAACTLAHSDVRVAMQLDR